MLPLSGSSKKQLFLFGFVFLAIITFIYVLFNSSWQNSESFVIVQVIKSSTNKTSTSSPFNYDEFDFEGFDNNNANQTRDRLLVPNIIHLIYLNLNEIKFYQCINIYSIFLNQKPDRIYIHCNKCEFTGKYWQELNSIDEIRRVLVVNKVKEIDTIFGKKVGWIQHRCKIYSSYF